MGELCLQRAQKLVHLFGAKEKGNEMTKSLEEDAVTFFFFHIESCQLHHGIEVDQACGLLFEVIAKSVLKFLLKLVGSVC